jgi:putative addiction module component (TIGR02574 family)
MTAGVEEITQVALTLDEHDRATLAATLLGSLDDGADDPASVASAWNAEIRSRVDDLRSGKVQPVPWSTVKAHLAADRAARAR